MTNTQIMIHPILDRALFGLKRESPRIAINELIDSLSKITSTKSPKTVKQHIQPVCIEHPVFEILRQDPYTSRSFEKPRGYAGDAGLIDYIYMLAAPDISTTHLGTEIFAQCMSTISCASVRHRRRLLSQMIDEMAARCNRQIQVLSMACGHLREALLCESLKNGCASLDGFDHDIESLKIAAKDCATLSVKVQRGSVRQALAGKLTPKLYDLVYSAGLYDYLNEGTAKRLTSRLFECVRPGGQLLVANFLPGNRERGYMEAFMDWYLIYRTRDQVAALSSEIDRNRIDNLSFFSDPEGYIQYCVISKSSSDPA